jgi:vanillate O-demethylase ferredoxin subunit
VLELKVNHLTSVTARIRCVELVAVGGGDLPAFTAGAHIDLTLGDDVTRSYSLLNDPHETHRYVLGVLREYVLSQARGELERRQAAGLYSEELEVSLGDFLRTMARNQWTPYTSRRFRSSTQNGCVPYLPR